MTLTPNRVETQAGASAGFGDFPATAPAANPVFYRTYSRRNDDGQREAWAETVSRVGHDIADLGHFNHEQHALVLEQALVDAEQAAFEANQRGDWSGALGALAESREASPFLRLQAGDARWNLRHLRSAELEYRAGMVDADAELRATLEQRLEGLQSELAPILAAESSARWLGWLCALVVAAGLGAALAIRRC